MRNKFFSIGALSIGVLSALALLVGCAGPAPPPPSAPQPAPGPDAIAVWDGGEISLIDVEDVLRTLSVEERNQREATIEDTYRELARELALLRIHLPETADPEQRLEVWRTEQPALYRRFVIQLYATMEILNEPPEISEDELETYYREHPELFHQEPHRLLRHVFRRPLQAGETGEDPHTVLTQVRARALAGEPFEELAKTWSQSENRRRGGEVGWITRGILPRALEDAVFALGRGEFSEPLVGKDGGLLFYVEEATLEKDFPFQDVRLALRRLLQRQRVNAVVLAAAREILPPEDMLALDADEVAAAPGDAIVLRVLAPEAPGAEIEVRKSALSAELLANPEQLTNALEAQRLQALLWAHAEREGFTARPEIRRRLARGLEAALRRGKLNEYLDAAARQRLDAWSAEVRALYDADPLRFAGPLRFHLRRLSVAIGGDPVEQMRSLEALLAERSSLDDIAAAVLGEVSELGWKSFAELAELDSKERVDLLDLGGPGFTLPYRLGESLHILQVVERQAPQPLPWEEAREQAREDYLRRHRDALWEEVATQMLEEVGYRYLEENVDAVLAVELPGDKADDAAP